jgi:uncharacterized protein (DUF2236 family)
MPAFVQAGSIVRTIWGRGDTILLIFAGASAEFALNKSVDWLYYTGRLPADPLGRLFSTVAYAQRIVFAEEEKALASIDSIAAIHKGVEQKRGGSIPAEAYLDVLFMLIGYSISGFELLERKLSPAEKEEVFAVFSRVGRRMGLIGLPDDYNDWERLREQHLRSRLERSDFSLDLYRRYRQSLGPVRYTLLLQAQILLVPRPVRRLLGLPAFSFLYPAIPLYNLVCFLHLEKGVKIVLLPVAYRAAVFQLDMAGLNP